MAHEIYNSSDMIYTGEKPWHGLGVEFPEPPSVDVIKAHPNFQFRVGLREMTLANSSTIVPSWMAVVREDTQQILSVVGERFSPLQNEDAIEWFRPFIESGVAKVETVGVLFGGKRFWMLARANGTAEVVPGDPVETFLLLSNGHDGTMALRLGYTSTRVVCSNTLTAAIADKRGSQLIALRHTKGMHAAMDTVREIMDVTHRTFEASVEQYRMLAKATCNDADFEKLVKVVFKSAKARKLEEIATPDNQAAIEAETATDGNRVLSWVKPLFEDGVGSNIKGVRGTYWGAYNAITEYLTHHRGGDAERRIDQNWFGTGAALNQRALQVATEMAVAA